MTEAVATINGKKLDARYTLLDKLGAGGQGEVWRAHDGTRGVDVALKVVNAASGRQEEAWGVLEHEYSIASLLDHPSILKVFAPERAGEAMVLPMELASGGDLRRLRGTGFLEIIPVLLEIAQALEHAHERGVVHRDLKPGNVLFDARGRARLADFGVAETAMTPVEAQGTGANGAATRDTNRHGFSPFTASPAQLRGEPPTPADDVYGLGALAYELLSGYPPYYPHFDKKRAIEERVPALVPTRQIPPLLGALVTKMLAKDPKQRPRTMRQVIDELDAALNDTLTFDFENVPPAAASTSAASALAASQASATTASDTSSRQFVWTPTSQDRRASADRRGRRREDLEPPISDDPGVGAQPRAGARSRDDAGANTSANGRSTPRSGAEALASINAVLDRAATESAAQPKSTQRVPLTPAAAAAIVAAARAAAQKPAPQPVPAPPATPIVNDAGHPGPGPGPGPSGGESYPTKTHWASAQPTESHAVPARPASAGAWPASGGAGSNQQVGGGPSIPTGKGVFGHTNAVPTAADQAVFDGAGHASTTAGHDAPPQHTRGNGVWGPPSAAVPPPDSPALTPHAGAQRMAADPAGLAWPTPDRATPQHVGGNGAFSHANAAPPSPAPVAPTHYAGANAASSHPAADLSHPTSAQPDATRPALVASNQSTATRPPLAATAQSQATRPALASLGAYPDVEPINAGTMHATWGEIPLDGLPKVARLEPIHPRRWPWVVMGLLAGAAAAIYFWLPRFDTEALPPEVAAVVQPLQAAIVANSPSQTAVGTNPIPTASASAASTGTSVPKITASNSSTGPVSNPPVITAGEEQRLRGMRQTFDNRLSALEARGAGVWGGHDFAAAKTRAAESVGARDAGNPRMALERLAVALKLLDVVESKAPQALTAQVAEGEKALGTGQQEVAGQAFDLARRISPSDRRATDGQRRAQNLNAVLPLLADAQNAETARDYARAAQDYSQALFLDPSNATAKAGQARANAAFGDDNYAKAVGSGFAALGAGRLDEAHEAFVKARALKPNGAEASEGQRRVGAALTARGFASMRQRAAGLEAQERWDEAERAYEDVLAADSSLAFAQEGKARTTSRADLSGRLQQLLDRPDRLASPGVREDARALVETARAQSPQGPVIRSQIARLEILLPGFDRPVRLSLLSDNSTEVVISSIGSFGAFARRDIELRPGRYTVVGTRNGFRDVRREITVAPGQDLQTIRVTCSEPI